MKYIILLLIVITGSQVLAGPQPQAVLIDRKGVEIKEGKQERAERDKQITNEQRRKDMVKIRTNYLEGLAMVKNGDGTITIPNIVPPQKPGERRLYAFKTKEGTMTYTLDYNSDMSQGFIPGNGNAKSEKGVKKNNGPLVIHAAASSGGNFEAVKSPSRKCPKCEVYVNGKWTCVSKKTEQNMPSGTASLCRD